MPLELLFTLLALCLAFCVLWGARGPGKPALTKLRAGQDDAGKLSVDHPGSVSCSTSVGRAQTGCSAADENEGGQGATSSNDTAQGLDARTTSVSPVCSESHAGDGSTSTISLATLSDDHSPLQWPWLKSAPIRRMRALLCKWFAGARLDVDEEMMEEGQEASVANLVFEVFELMILRLAERRSEFEYPSWEAVPESVRSPILSLGSFAFRMLQAEQVVFTQTELQASTILRDAISLGLLVACEHTPAEATAKQWRFSHLTLQESLAAKFISCSGTMTGGKIVQLVEFFGPDAGHMRTFWVLLAAELNATCLETLVNALMMREKKDTCLCLTATALDSNRLAFPLKYCRPLRETLTNVSLDRLAEFLLSPVVEGSGAMFVRNRMSRVHSPSDEDFLEATLTTWVSEFPAATDEMLVKAVSSVNGGAAQLCREVMEQSGEVASDRPHSLPVPDDLQIRPGDRKEARRLLMFQCFAEYALHHNHAVEPVPSMTEILESTRPIFVVSGHQNPSLVRSVEIVVKHHSHALRRVFLERFTDSGVTTIPPSLRLCTKLCKLVVLSWPRQHEEIIADIIRASSSTLRKLYLTPCSMSCSGVENLAPGIGECSQLENLSMPRSMFSLDSIKLLAAALSKMTKLQKLNLIGGMAPGVAEAAMPYLCEALAANGMKYLNVSYCGLSGSSLLAIASALQHWTNLEKLELAGNDFSKVTADQCREFTEAVSAHGKLRELTLYRIHVPPDHPLACEASYPRHLTVTGREQAELKPQGGRPTSIRSQ